MSQPIHILLADTHFYAAQGMVSCLQQQGFEVTDLTSRPDTLLQCIPRLQPRLVILCATLQHNNQPLWRTVLQQPGAPNLLLLLPEPDAPLICHAAAEGALGFVCRNAPPHDLAEAITTTINGKLAFCRQCTLVIGRQLTVPKPLFSQRELEVLRCICQGKTDREIAASLLSSYRNVCRIIEQVKKKAGVQARTALASYATRHHLV